MTRKSFIAIKPGLFRDPKHHQNMGEGVWLYGYLVDHVDWSTGQLAGFKDDEVAADMEMSIDWVRKWRRRLEAHGYIASSTRGHLGQCVQITKWINPREQTSKGRTNVPQSSGMNVPLSDLEGGTNVIPTPPEGGTQSGTNVIPPTLDSHDHIKDRASAPVADQDRKLHQHPAVQAYRFEARSYPPKAWYQDIADAVGEVEADVARWQSVVKHWIGKGWKPGNVAGMLEIFAENRHPGEAPDSGPARVRLGVNS